MSPYQISNEVFQIVNGGTVILSDAGIGPLQLIPTPDDDDTTEVS